jgi:signal transduction histidine kinase
MMSMSGTAVLGRPGSSRGVLVAAAATVIGVAPLVPVVNADSFATGALYLAGWPVLGVVAAVLLDRRPGSRVGLTLVVLAALPGLLVMSAALAAGPHGLWDRVAALAPRVDVAALLLALAAVGWAVGFAPDRMSRRRLVWVVLWSAVLVASVAAASLLASPRTLGLVTALGLCGLAGALLRLETATEFRRVDEVLVDVAAVVAAVLVAAGAGTGVRVVAARTDLPLPDVAAVFTAVLTAVLAWPAALWLRRSLLERRYGTGTLPAPAVAAMTEDLRADADPRELLGKAAVMIATASGHPHVRLVLGADAPDLPDGWIEHPLVIGGERVGTLAIGSAHPEGPEPRQERVVAQLLPTVALMTRAVGLAVEAQQTRTDVARERESERTRILSDLHDGVGPVLAGMSMRVQAELRRRPTPLLSDLAGGLADARDDLRRIVSDLTPPALHGRPLAEALEHLAGVLAQEGTPVRLEARIGSEPSAETAVAVYRSVAEGVTNALRHGRAAQVEVRVRTTADGWIEVDVQDDGVGGPLVPGVGLTSLGRRAEQLGGHLEVRRRDPAGVRLLVRLPAEAAA